MFGSEILDVLIGLIVVFLMLSLIAAAVREGIEGWMKTRAVFLEEGIRRLLNDPNGDAIARQFYEHPLIRSLFRQDMPKVTEANDVNAKAAKAKALAKGRASERWFGSELPTYIPSKNFAVALMELVATPPPTAASSRAQTKSTFTIDGLRDAASDLKNEHVRAAMLSAIDSAYGDIRAVQANLEAWFDSAMDRVSGWYKRRTQLHLFVIGLVLSAMLNVDPITIARHLWTNDAARDALARRAAIFASDTTYIRAVSQAGSKDSTATDSVPGRTVRRRFEDLESLNLPIGWNKDTIPSVNKTGLPWVAWWWLRTIMGFALTASAVTLGAPFWFDLLNKVMVIRSTVKPREKSQEEGSEDRKSTTPVQK